MCYLLSLEIHSCHISGWSILSSALKPGVVLCHRRQIVGTILVGIVRHIEGIYKFEREPALIATARSIRVGLLDFPISGWSAYIGLARSYRANTVKNHIIKCTDRAGPIRSGQPDQIGLECS